MKASATTDSSAPTVANSTTVGTSVPEIAYATRRSAPTAAAAYAASIQRDHAGASLSLVGIDRTWAVFLQSVVERDGAGPTTLTVADVLTGRTTFAHTYNGAAAPKYPSPTAAGGFAVTDQGVLAWMSAGVLYALVETYKIVVLPSIACIEGVCRWKCLYSAAPRAASAS